MEASMTKQDLQNFVSRLPEGDYSIEDLQYRLTLFARLQDSLAEGERGELYSLEQVEDDLDQWLPG